MNPQPIKLPISLIDLGPNVRIEADDKKDAELAESIRQHGLRQPVGVVGRGERYELWYGFRRLKATQAAGETEILALVWPDDPAPAERTVVQLVENVQRSDVNPADMALAVAGLIDDAGWSGKEVAGKLGMSAPMVSKWHAIAHGPAQVIDELRRGKITIQAAYQRCVEAAKGEAKADAKPPRAARPRRAQPAAWRMSRTIHPGLMLTVWESVGSAKDLVAGLERFLTLARTAAAEGVPLARLLADCRNAEGGAR